MGLTERFFQCNSSVFSRFARYRFERGYGENKNANINYAWQKRQNMLICLAEQMNAGIENSELVAFEKVRTQPFFGGNTKVQ
jgi:hypothetical protein